MCERVLVTDGEQRAALAVVRSLGRAGYEAYVASTRGRSLAGASRHAAAEAATLNALHEPAAFVAALRELIERWRIRALIPISEPALLAVLGARDQLGVLLPFPSLTSFRRVSDKSELVAAARGVGIAIPEQSVLRSREEVQSLDFNALPYPLVIKPARSVGEQNGSRVKLGVSYASHPELARARLQALPPAAFPVLLQQRVVGPGVGIFVLLWRGQLLAEFAHRRIREKPPSGGVSVYRESIPADPQLVERSRHLLEQFDWEGVAMVEFKMDEATGTPYLMEVNGRFWGSLQLAVDAGVDFPALLLQAALGHPPTSPPPYRSGIRNRWWWGDVDQLITRLRHSDAELDLPPDAPSRLRSVVDFLQLWRPGDRNEILRWSDPVPFIRESIDWFARR